MHISPELFLTVYGIIGVLFCVLMRRFVWKYHQSLIAYLLFVIGWPFLLLVFLGDKLSEIRF